MILDAIKNANLKLFLPFFLVTSSIAVLMNAAYVYIPVIFSIFFLARTQNLSPLFSILIFAFFALIVSSSKVIEGDLIAYKRYYDYVAANDLNTVLYAWLSESSVRVSEFIFKFYNYTLSSLGANFSFFHSFSIFIIYVCLFLLSLEILKTLKPSNNENNIANYHDKIFAILWTFLVAISFTLTSQVLKQYLSMMFFSLALIFFLKNKKIFFLFLLSLSIFTHNASIVLIPFFIFSYLFKNYFKSNLFKLILISVSFALGSLFLNIINALGLSSLFMYGGMEDSNLGITVLLDAVMIFLVFFILPKKNDANEIQFFKAFIFTFICFLVFARDIPIILLRVYFYMDIFRIFFGIYIYQSFKRNDRSIILICLALIGPIYWNLKLFSSGWDYSWYNLSDSLMQFLLSY